MKHLVYKEYGKKSGVYKIYSKDKVYVGSSKNLAHRIAVHISDLMLNKHSNPYLQNVVNKYGLDYLEVEVLELTDNLLDREQYYIDSLNCITPNGYNLCAKAYSRAGVKQPKDAVERTAAWHRGRKHSEEHKKKLSESHKGKVMSKEWRDAISKGNKGVSRKSGRKIPIIQLTKEGVFVKEWESMLDAAKTLGISVSHICACCKGNKASIGGYRWKYK